MKKIVLLLLPYMLINTAHAVEMTLPSQKGSALNTAEFEANHKRQVTQKTTDYTAVITDNRDVIEVNAAGAVTITLSDASTMVASSDTGDYQVTITSIGAGTTTVARSDTDTISGATSYTLKQYDTAIFKVNDTGNGYSVIAFYNVNDINTVNLYTTGDIGIGTTTVPHAGIGGAMFAIEGTDSSETAGPNVQFTTAADNYPLVQFLNYAHDNSYISFDAYSDGTWTSSDAGSNYQIAKVGDGLLLRYDSGITAGSTVTWNTGLSLSTAGLVTIPGAATITGALTHSLACEAGYTRVAANFCLKNDVAASTALTRDTCTTVTTPSANAKAILIIGSAIAKSGNSIGGRQTVLHAYDDSGCITADKSIVNNVVYEHVAISAGTELGASGDIQHWVIPASTGANIYLKYADDDGNQGTAFYDVIGYTD